MYNWILAILAVCEIGEAETAFAAAMAIEDDDAWQDHLDSQAEGGIFRYRATGGGY